MTKSLLSKELREALEYAEEQGTDLSDAVYDFYEMHNSPITWVKAYDIVEIYKKEKQGK